jgi:hypothetical protein
LRPTAPERQRASSRACTQPVSPSFGRGHPPAGRGPLGSPAGSTRLSGKPRGSPAQYSRRAGPRARPEPDTEARQGLVRTPFHDSSSLPTAWAAWRKTHSLLVPG